MTATAPGDAASRLGGGHYLKPGKGGSTPGTVMFLTAATQRAGGRADAPVQLESWALRCVYRRHKRYAGEILDDAGTQVDDLAPLVDKWACVAEAAWLYAYDTVAVLGVTALAEGLCALGWELSRQFGTSPSAMWLVLHKGRHVATRSDREGPGGGPAVRIRWTHTLTIADAQALSVVAPAGAAAAAADPAVLAGAVLTLMDWWDRQQLGRWSITGASLGWNSYRATLKPKGVVIDHDPEMIAFERSAVYGGRRDVAVVGTPGAPRYAELDFEAAHPTIAAHCLLPCAYGGQLPAQGFNPALWTNPSIGIIAEVTISTDRPRWPARIGGKVFYPVGTFRTVLAGPDLADAWAARAVVAVHEAHWYRMSRHLKPWGEWVSALMTADPKTVPEPVRRAAKNWSRAVIGKFAQRGWTTKPWVGPPCDGWVVQQTPIVGKAHQVMTIGLNGVYYLSQADQRGDHERPAVLAFVEAHVRSRLSALIDGAYQHAVVQWDTDGMIVSLPRLGALARELGHVRRRGAKTGIDLDGLLRDWSARSWPLKIRCKTVMERMVIYGPQHVVSDTLTKLAGVPRGAVEVTPGVYAAEVRTGATRASPEESGGLGAPVTAKYTINGPYAAGWVLHDGTVRPPETVVDENGATVLLAWERTRWAARGDVLGPLQALWAAGLWRPAAPPVTCTPILLDG